MERGESAVLHDSIRTSQPELTDRSLHRSPKYWISLARSHTESIPESVRIVLLGITHILLLALMYQILRPLAAILRILSERMAAKISV